MVRRRCGPKCERLVTGKCFSLIRQEQRFSADMRGHFGCSKDGLTFHNHALRELPVRAARALTLA